MKRDLTFVAGLEKEIAKKYGTEAIQNPKGNWTEENQGEYEAQAKKSSKESSLIKRTTRKNWLMAFMSVKN